MSDCRVLTAAGWGTGIGSEQTIPLVEMSATITRAVLYCGDITRINRQTASNTNPRMRKWRLFLPLLSFPFFIEAPGFPGVAGAGSLAGSRRGAPPSAPADRWSCNTSPPGSCHTRLDGQQAPHTVWGDNTRSQKREQQTRTLARNEQRDAEARVRGFVLPSTGPC